MTNHLRSQEILRCCFPYQIAGKSSQIIFVGNFTVQLQMTSVLE